ncbi:cytochrome c, class II [Paracoccus denitrificans PD1222]|uniref:Cytochrome c, class II n=2 Tax=Paracoccus denitrificans TaxID=266 RepID=A1B537_PARDP|nr:cytochrome c, class II [Paracoccus denitrificans PD1222]
MPHERNDDMRLILTAAALAAVPLVSLAQDDPVKQAIDARHGFYQMLAINMGTLSGMAKGDVAYDEAAASRAAANIEALTQYDLPSLFIEGSSSADAQDSAAKPDIWSNPEDFGTKFAGLGEAATGASDAVKGGAGEVGAVVQKLGGACKACHDDYREKS